MSLKLTFSRSGASATIDRVAAGASFLPDIEELVMMASVQASVAMAVVTNVVQVTSFRMGIDTV